MPGQKLRVIITSASNVCSAIILTLALVRFAHVISSFGRSYLRAVLKTVCVFLANHRPRILCGDSYFPLTNVGLIFDRIFSCSQYTLYGIDNRLRLRIDLDIHTLTQFFLPSVVRSSVSGIKCTQKRVGVTSPTVKLMPSTPIKPLYRIYFISDASCTLNHT